MTSNLSLVLPDLLLGLGDSPAKPPRAALELEDFLRRLQINISTNNLIVIAGHSFMIYK